MLSSSRQFDSSNELYIKRHRNGVKLMRLDNVSQDEEENILARTLNQAMKLPFSFCLLDTQSRIVRMNQAGSELNGYSDEKDLIGKSLFDLYEHRNAQALRDHDISILKSNKIVINENIITRHDECTFNNLIIDAPCYDNNDYIVGILGFSIVIGSQPIHMALNYFRELDLLTSSFQNSAHNYKLNNSLSKRQYDCLKLLAKGMPYKQIGIELSLSPRTVEHYIDAIKIKFKCDSRFELISLFQNYISELSVVKK